MSTNKDLKNAAVPERSASSALADRLKKLVVLRELLVWVVKRLMIPRLSAKMKLWL